MKRLHVNVAVADLDVSIRFYSSLFATKPSLVKSDYAKWMLEDPRVNFAITTRGSKKGIDHLGIQVENEEELGDVYARLKQTGGPVLEQGNATCCYAQSDKNWISDPEGIAWETFLTKGESPVYGFDTDVTEQLTTCCSKPTVVEPKPAKSCCEPTAVEEEKRKTI